MRSLYRRQLAMMVSIMLVSFTLLAGAFMLLSYRYIIGETRDSVERNAGYVTSFTASYYRTFLSLEFQDDFYRNYVASIARISNSDIIVADPKGKIIYNTAEEEPKVPEGGVLPEALTAQVLNEGSFNGMTTLGGLYEDKRYLAALPVVNQLGQVTVDRKSVV